ncbi:hypothetical protein B0J13DRAFT_524527 [Dactylonectria estremocensis]|uniref:Uncharacterized protein n=1 Tax=Dactylonectria estremocensis TaxID=1079267 RepID=A0A9P9EY85_9HYPO|nr:hypothetical protein B0J13DRAFT_524527 [Dactylonectria estremocensis]
MHKNLVPLALLGTLTEAVFLPLQERATASTTSRAVLAAAPPSEAGQTGSPTNSQIPGIQDSSVVSLYGRAEYRGQVPFNGFPEDVELPPKQCALCEGIGHGSQITSTTAIYGRPSNNPPMPKLSTTTSPTGSSCVSTATVTTCRYVGVGHGSVCVENPTCLSWVPINSPPLDTGCIAHEDCANYWCVYGSHVGCFIHKLGNAVSGIEEESTPEEDPRELR